MLAAEIPNMGVDDYEQEWYYDGIEFHSVYIETLEAPFHRFMHKLSG